jgi:glutamyl-tRNA synthetase
MDEDLRDRVREAAEKHALLNAVKHEGEADVGAIMGPLMGENPEFRPHGDEIPGVISPVLDEINGLSHADRRERLAELAPRELEEIEAEDESDEHPLPDLPSAEAYDEIRMRCAPNPNGPWHVGHGRMAAVIGTYKERYDGWFCVRFDDTDPETSRPDLEAYETIIEDIEYLGFEPDAVYRASDRLEAYYDHARELIDLGGAYTCSCPGEEFSELKNDAEPCPHRDKDPEPVLEEFEAMIDGEYDAGDLVLRVKTDIEHKNPALRDWVAFRMIDRPHPREAAAEYRCWPMLDFQSGIDDHLIGITHIIRGIDLQDSAKRQRFVYDYFDWEYPEVVHWGHVQIDGYDVPLSTSTMAEMIETGELDGWDDPRAPTLRSLRRRGIRGQAIVDAMVDLGTSTSNVDLSMSSIYANNRELVDDQADRYFLVRDGERLQIDGGPEIADPPRHPDHGERGTREIPVDDAVLLEPDDRPGEGERVWLKGYGCLRAEEGCLVWTDDEITAVREEGVPVVHWVPAEHNVPVSMRTPSGDVDGYAEPAFENTTVDEVIQFVRVGFVHIDRHASDEHLVSFAHE